MATAPMNTTNNGQDPDRSILCAVLDDGEIALARVIGRGNFSNSEPLKRFANHVVKRAAHQKFIVDLHECESMDSTFMGVLAGICISERDKENGSEVILVNVNDHCHRLLKNLGLMNLLEIRSNGSDDISRAEGELKPAEGRSLDKLEQICLTLAAHKNLIKVDEKNEVRFQAVIEYLEKDLAKNQKSCPTDEEE